jgi:hypothetical protein
VYPAATTVTNTVPIARILPLLILIIFKSTAENERNPCYKDLKRQN